MTPTQTLAASPSRPLAGPFAPASLLQPLAVMLAFMIAVFALGGGSRDDILSLALLRPLSVLVLGYALVTADPARLRANRAMLALAGAWTGLVALHLVPLPPALWQALPGRELAAEITRVAGLGDVWRSLSLVPHRTLNSLLSLTVPLAALLLALRMRRRELIVTVYGLIALGMASAVLGLVQVIGPADGSLYLYRITNEGSAVGLFANRNHQAVMLALTIAMLGAVPALLRESLGERRMAAHSELARAGSMGLALAMLPFLIVTQSRAGLVLGVIALGVCFWFQRNGSGVARNLRGRAGMLAGILGALALAALTWLFTASNALERLGQSGSADDGLRFAIWGPTLDLAWQHFPTGSGFGTFVEVYQTLEPASTLGPSYINRAHSDWLEVVLTGGLPAIAILGAGLVWLGLRARRALAEARGADRVLRQLGCAVLLICAIGSVYDYPLRTPALAIGFILALVWIAGSRPEISQKDASDQALTDTAKGAGS